MSAATSENERLIVALDVSSALEAQKIVASLGDSAHFFKVGMQLYTAAGPAVVRDLLASGRRVFLDLKYHDIPNTVSAAVCEAGQLGASMLTVHASGSSKMLKAAADAAATRPGLQVLAVTVLTSLNEEDLRETGVSASVSDQVVRLASMSLKCGCAGVVSSAREAKTLRTKLGDHFLIVTPGVRPAGAEYGDQARVTTPAEAIAAGASHIVVGRPITAAEDPAAAARSIQQQIRSVAEAVAK